MALSKIKTNSIEDDAVTATQIAADAVDTSEIAASAVETAEILDANVTLAKIANQAANTVLVRDASSSGVVSAKAVATTEILIGDGTGFTAAALSGDTTMTNAGAVTIADNAVTLGKMAGLARGKIIVGDASGDPSALTVGTSGQYLTSDGSDASWGAVTSLPTQTSNSGKVLITDGTDASWDTKSNRNFLMNGDMQIWQRATSTASITTDGYYTADRWTTGVGTCGTWTQQRSGNPVLTSEGTQLLEMICTTANASLSAGSYLKIEQRIEGYNLQPLKKGTADAESVTVSFWVRASKTGTYILEINDADNSRHICKAYTIDTANTFEFKSLTFAGDTTGAMGWDANYSMRLFWWLSAGSDKTSGTLATSWASYTQANEAVGQVNLADATTGRFYLGLVKMEIGTVATSYEFEDYAKVLADCQRYYYEMPNAYGVGNGTKGLGTAAVFPVTMRASPGITVSYGGVDDRIYRVDTAALIDGSWTMFKYAECVSHFYDLALAAFGAVGVGFIFKVVADAEL